MNSKFKSGDRVYLVPKIYNTKIKGSKTNNEYMSLKECDLGTVIEDNGLIIFVRWDKYPDIDMWVTTRSSNNLIKKYEKDIDNGMGI